MKMRRNNRSRIAAIALAAATSFAFVGTIAVDGFSSAAFAGGNGNKGGNGKGNDNAGGNKGGISSANRSGGNSRQVRIASTETTDTLHPSQKGKWNANPNQHALDAHVRNQNFNGTVGALAMYQLASLADSGAELTPEQQAALDALYAEYGITDTVPDEDQLSLLELAVIDATDTGDGEVYSYEVNEDGTVTVSCDDGGGGACDDTVLAELQDEADAIELTGSEAELVAIAEGVILERSNKTYDDQTFEILLDEMAALLGFERGSEDDTTEDTSVE